MKMVKLCNAARCRVFAVFSAVTEMSHNMGDLKAFWGNFFANFLQIFLLLCGCRDAAVNGIALHG